MADLQKIDPKEARRLIGRGDAQAVDLRDDDAWRESHVAGAIHSPPGELDSDAGELEGGTQVVLVADDDDVAREAAEALQGRDLEVALLDGGMKAWLGEGFQAEPSDDPDEDAPIEPDAAR